MNESGHNMHLEPLQENEEILEDSIDDQDSSILKIYEEVLSAKKHNFIIEQRIQKIERRPAEAEKTLKDAEETIRATCQYLKEQSVIIEAQAKKIKEYEKKDIKNEERMKTQFAKFEEILSKMKTDGNIDQIQNHFNKVTEVFKYSPRNPADVLNEFENQLAATLETVIKSQYDELNKVQKQISMLGETFAPESIFEELKELKNQLELQNTELKEVHDRLDTWEAIQENNKEKGLAIDKIQAEAAIEMRRQLEKLSENHQIELESLKSQINQIEKLNNKIEEKVQNELEKFGLVQKNALEKMKNQLNMFLKHVRKQIVREPELDSSPHVSSFPLKEIRKRSSGSPYSDSPIKKKTDIVSEDYPVAANVNAEEVVEDKEDKCIFCDVFGHESMKCEKFTTGVQRRLKLEDRNICIKCLDSNNIPERKDHNPCPKADEKCPNCVKIWPDDKEMTIHHSVVCRVNARPFWAPKRIFLPQRDVNEIYCVFCDNRQHDSVDCTEFLTCTQRTMKLRQRKICLRCLEPNNINNGNSHFPCPKGGAKCPNCVDEWPGIKDMSNHHLLLCAWTSTPDKLSELSD